MLKRAVLTLLALLAISGAIVAAILYSGACVGETGQQDTDAYKYPQETNSKYQRVFTTVECGVRTLRGAIIAHTNEISMAITAIATLFIALYAFALSDSTRALRDVAERQKSDMIESLKIASKAANAAEKSALVADNSLKLANRPLITISPIALVDQSMTSASHIHFGCRNNGKGTGIVSKIAIFVSILMQRALTVQWNTTLINSDSNSAIEVGDMLVVDRVESPLLTTAEVAKIREGESSLLVTIQILYQDILKTDYDQRFPFIFDHARGEFIRNDQFVEEKKETNGQS
jgi:hypothetical protein